MWQYHPPSNATEIEKGIFLFGEDFMKLDNILTETSTPQLLREEFYTYKKIKTDELANPPRINIQVGVDGISWEGFEKNIENECIHISERVKRGTYFFQPFREIEVAKNPELKLIQKKHSNDVRVISIASIRDVLVQRIIYKVIINQAESQFNELSNISFAYRKGKSAPEAAKIIYKHIQNGYTTILDADIEGFFDNISHDILFDKITLLLNNGENPLLHSYLKRFIAVDRVKWEDYKGNYKKFHTEKPIRTIRKEGIPQGGVLSGLLANLFMHDFDMWILRELGKEFDIKYVRYADDFVVLMKDNEKISMVKKRIKERLDDIQLRLHPNTEKTKIIDLKIKGTHVNFVGFAISPTGIRIKQANIVRFKRRLLEILKETNLFEKHLELNPVVSKFTYKLLGNETLGLRVCTSCNLFERRRSWLSYFSIITDVQQLRGLDFWIKKQLYQKYFKETGRRLKANELSQYQLARLERLYYRFKKLNSEEFCKCKVSEREFQRKVLIDNLFKY